MACRTGGGERRPNPTPTRAVSGAGQNCCVCGERGAKLRPCYPGDCAPKFVAI